MTLPTLKVAAATEPKSLAGALTARLKETDAVVLEFMGEDAYTKALAAICIARGHLAPRGEDCVIKPDFADLTVGANETRKGYQLTIIRVRLAPAAYAEAYESR
jgi:stage V sporulation protein S